MKSFKVEVVKWLDKHSFVRKWESEIEVRQALHKEGYSILSIELYQEEEIQWNKFFFEINENWEKKVWVIVKEDIFKAYLKLKDQLGYEVEYIYTKKDDTLDEKKKIIFKLKEQYKIYRELNKKKLESDQINQEKKIKVVEEEKIETFQMKKELDEVYKIIDKVLIKLQYFIEQPEGDFLNFDKKSTLKQIYTSLVTLKNSTNINKLKQIGERALVKIWEIELQILESNKSQESKEVLLATNKLLKEVGSKTTFVSKDDDIVYIVKNLFSQFIQWFQSKKWGKNQKLKNIDTSSNSYLKTKLQIQNYEAKLTELRKLKIKNFLIYIFSSKENIKKRDYFFLREKTIKQNIFLLKSRLTWVNQSYTKVIKGYYTFRGQFLAFLQFFKTPIFYITLFYTLIFLVFNVFNSLGIVQFWINFYGMLYFLLLNLFYILLSKTTGFVSLSINIVIFVFLFIFWVINF